MNFNQFLNPTKISLYKETNTRDVMKIALSQQKSNDPKTKDEFKNEFGSS